MSSPFIARLCPGLVAAALGLTAVAGRAQAPAPPIPVAHSDTSEYDDSARMVVMRGNAKLTYDDVILTADELRYNRETGDASARGHLIITKGSRRLVAEQGTYNFVKGTLHIEHLRYGQFPLYITADVVEGTFDRLVFRNATVFFREENAFAPSVKASELVYERNRIVSAQGLKVGFLGGHFLALPQFHTDLHSVLISYLSGEVGYRRNLGPYAEIGLHLPVADGVKVGGDVGLYTARGLMVGPSGTYSRDEGDDSMQGFLKSGYISDHGDRGIDFLGHPVPSDRGYVEWQHQQQIGDHFTLNGEVNYWSDPAILRDFKPKWFFPVQQPDTFLEGAYTGENFVLSAFTRANPNPFFRAQDRLPEIRFDLLPTPLAYGIVQRFDASFAVLQEDAYQNLPGLRSDRIDAYYGLERPIALAPWLSFTPVAGGRITYYADAVGGRDTYTRTIGEVGFDAVLHANGTFNYKNELWDIDGLRHLLEPRISYRYAPRADDGQPYIPNIDSQVFTTYLQPLSIADQRNVDQLDALNTFRFALNNTLQTRDPEYGSRDLLKLNFAADYTMLHQAGRPFSDLYTEAALMPAPWLHIEAFQRWDVQDHAQDELNYGIEVVDQKWWSVRLAAHFLRDEYEQYLLDYRQRINEAHDFYMRLLYDAHRGRFNEQTFGITQRLGQTWNVRYEVSFTSGNTREGAFGVNVQVDLLRF
ncbi:MAG TPA: LPS assembly protein LptD [Candidatus Didemnitutus sp.]|nr:LPS assembly protein LptD [Candidatus Didemnitutus sp.]